ncbi:MAG: DUF2341 domain-containing protein, partial [Gammaproteobacteria bacterium]|nr:DUF2341 domain-containing protein [Gammaproteobacteria bacterium]
MRSAVNKQNKTKMQRFFIFCLTAVLLLLSSNAYAAWYNSAWQYRKLITIDSAQVTGTNSNIPILISITDTHLSAAQANGEDFLFTSSDGTTKLDHEITAYNDGTGALLAWVKIPSLTDAADVDIYLYYGNSSAPDQQNTTDVWDGNFLGVWHLNESGITDETVTFGAFSDSTINEYDASQFYGADAASGKINNAHELDGNDHIGTGVMSSLATTITMSMWFRSDDAGSIGNDSIAQRLMTQHRTGAASRFTFGINNNRLATAWNDAGTNWTQGEGTTTLSAGTWYHGTVTYDGTTVRLYLNGTQEYSLVDTMIAPSGDLIYVGSQTSGRYFDGGVDEVRISQGARSADWIATEYANQSNPSGFITVSESTPPAAITDLATGTITDSTIQLTWTAPGDDNNDAATTATSYDIRYRTDAAIDASNWASSAQISGEPAPSVQGTGESYTVSGLLPSKTYYFAIKTSDEIPNQSTVSNSVSGTTAEDTTAPSDVADLAASTLSNDTIQLTWTAPGDNGASGTATTYDVRYSTTGIIDTGVKWDAATLAVGEPIPSIASTGETFIVSALASSTQYWFAIKTADEQPIWSGLSNSPNATTSASDTTAPAAISDLAIWGTTTKSTIGLTWTAPGDDGSNGTAATYEIRRNASGTCNWGTSTLITNSLQAQPAGSTEYYTVTGLTPGTTYCFMVKTVDEIP